MKTKKIISTISLSLAIFYSAFSQTSLNWARTYGGNSMEIASCICPVEGGGYLLGGTSSSPCSGSKTDCLKGVTDYWVVRVDEQGNKLWDKTYGGSTFDELVTIQPLNDGGYILGGNSTSSVSGDKSEDSRGDFDYWIVKINAQGDKIWDKTFGGSDQEHLYCIKQTEDGGYLLGGSSSSGISGDKSESSKGQNNFWIVKTDASGNKEWDRTIGGDGDDILTAFQPTSDGGYLLAGYSNSGKSIDKSENSRGQNDFWIVKINGTGNILWDRTIGGSGDDVLICITKTTNGGYLLGGYSNSGASGEKHEPLKGGYDYWVVEISEQGKIGWERTFGGKTDEKLFSIKATDDGGFILCGNAFLLCADKTNKTSVNWLIKLDENGSLVWDEQIGLNTSNYFKYADVSSTKDSGFVLLGYTSENLSAFLNKQSQPATTDFCLMKLSSKRLLNPNELLSKNK